jgi:hypothetical protein
VPKKQNNGGKRMEIVVDDRAFVIGLSELFRQEMKSYEVGHLLPLAETACIDLDLSPANVTVEGYYTESDELERFFQLIRALQDIEVHKVSDGTTKTAIFRLREVLTSPAMGRVESNDILLPRTTSPFGEALQILSNWSIDGLCQEAKKLVRKDDSGLVAVAAAAGDPVCLCAARESMALVADVELAEMQPPEFTWGVSKGVAEVAVRFVSCLANATGIILPEPISTFSHLYGQAARDAELIGRCVLIGELFGNPYPYYHWYIDSQNGQLRVKDFWSSSIWTTGRLRNIPIGSWPAMGAKVEASGLKNESRFEGATAPSDTRMAAGGKESPNGWFSRLFRRGR